MKTQQGQKRRNEPRRPAFGPSFVQYSNWHKGKQNVFASFILLTIKPHQNLSMYTHSFLKHSHDSYMQPVGWRLRFLWGRCTRCHSEPAYWSKPMAISHPLPSPISPSPHTPLRLAPSCQKKPESLYFSSTLALSNQAPG